VTDFSRLDAADNFLAAVAGSIRRRVMSAGTGSWNHAPEYSQARSRAAGILARAVRHREREVARLVASAPVPAAEGIVRARLHANAEARTSRALARYRDPSPLGRASR
jgi:hypothetical protein